MNGIIFSKPCIENSKDIFNLIKRCDTLDLNSEYLYLLQCSHFKKTCGIAILENEVIGFVSGYFIPDKNDTLFIWQVAVDEKFRGQNIAIKIIIDIYNRNNINNKIKYILSTVSPSNNSSKRVFEKLADNFNTKIENKTLFSLNDFLDSHEEEIQYLIGPINN
ncbi:diaminobutyrate acetyltransferase [Arcobacter defluvii]|uniref:L-2,4-diaminobutyric acid acetyltransferase n=1 Tax=Arcobacter defluvii TaxID=873191 RepID=A0AAE7E6R6_9BACT|nr:diaminobutyrate acetyltransferase [Arcobacter defluvii]QKF78200.1 diaminobutanoate acetyltransferase [Arcobacter defluvii]RXI33304.1 diaminobutyrate acetyltransferase [Arcobacter defluvii]